MGGIILLGCIKIDKTVCMNFLHSFLGGIFGGIVVAFALGQKPLNWTLGYSLVFLFFFVLIAILGVLSMGFLNYMLDKGK